MSDTFRLGYKVAGCYRGGGEQKLSTDREKEIALTGPPSETQKHYNDISRMELQLLSLSGKTKSADGE